MHAQTAIYMVYILAYHAIQYFSSPIHVIWKANSMKKRKEGRKEVKASKARKKCKRRTVFLLLKKRKGVDTSMPGKEEGGDLHAAKLF